MAVTRPFTIEGVLELEITGLELEGVQFTDDTFDGELIVQNRSEKQLVGTIEFVNESEVTLGSDRTPLSSETIEVDVAPNDTQRVPVGGAGIVGGTGTAILVGVKAPTVSEGGNDTLHIQPGDAFAPLASMVFWDREFYRVNYQRPRRAQYLSVVFALLSAFLAGVIVLVTV